MNEIAQQRLCEMIREYTRQVVNEPHRLRGLIADYCYEFPLEKTLLIGALEEGIPAELMRMSDGIPVDAIAGRMVQRLIANRGLSTEAATWTSRAWLTALGYAAPGGNGGQPPPAIPAPPPTPAVVAAPVPVIQPPALIPVFPPAHPIPAEFVPTPTPPRPKAPAFVQKVAAFLRRWWLPAAIFVWLWCFLVCYGLRIHPDMGLALSCAGAIIFLLSAALLVMWARGDGLGDQRK